MRTLWANLMAIYRKELQGYFASPLAYIVAAVFWLLSGILFVQVLRGVVTEASIRDQLGDVAPIDVAYQLSSNFLGWLGIIALFLLPLLSMGLYAEERKRGTLELLATSPITNWVVAIGKLLGVLTFFITILLPTVIYEAIALSTSNPPIQPNVILLQHAGLILLAAAVLSLGMFISSLTDSTILSAFLTFGVVLLLLFFNWMADSLGGVSGQVLGYLSILKHYANFIQGILDTSSLILFGSYVVLGIFLTALSIEALRFQRS